MEGARGGISQCQCVAGCIALYARESGVAVPVSGRVQRFRPCLCRDPQRSGPLCDCSLGSEIVLELLGFLAFGLFKWARKRVTRVLIRWDPGLLNSTVESRG